MKNKIVYIGGGMILVLATLWLIKVKVSSANTDTLVAKWLAKHPESRDSSGVGKVPLLIRLISNSKEIIYK